MTLRGSSGGKFRFKPTRPMLIVIGLLVVLLIIVVVLGLTVLRPQAGRPVAQVSPGAGSPKAVPSPTATAAPPATAAAPAAGPTLTPLPTTTRPAVTVTPVPTFAPAPTEASAAVGTTPTVGVGGGELPGGAGGLSWEVLLLIPAGLLLLAVAAWWRWRRVPRTG
ncbi:MAG: hypothetical protein ACPL7G_06985 [Chloroflexia bacterium]